MVSESADQISVIRFDSSGAKVVETLRTGLMPAEINGPHGIVVAPDGDDYYVSVAHGSPFGTLWKYSTDSNVVEGRTTLGMFPASVAITPDGEFVYVANFNVHGDMVPSSVSVVAAEAMLEVARIATCTMPHGSAINTAGTRHYSTCMMDDMLVEIDTRTLSVSRHFRLTSGSEHGMAGAPHVPAARLHRADHAANPEGGASHAGRDSDHHGGVTCSPTWAQPSADGSSVYVACNKAAEIVEIDATSWAVSRRFQAGKGVYNLGVTPDGRMLVATNKSEQSISVFELSNGTELARISTGRPVVHGVAISPDSRYAFISVEGIGAEPGTVEIIDLRSLRSVARVDVGQQAAGIDFWKMEEGS